MKSKNILVLLLVFTLSACHFKAMVPSNAEKVRKYNQTLIDLPKINQVAQCINQESTYNTSPSMGDAIGTCTFLVGHIIQVNDDGSYLIDNIGDLELSMDKYGNHVTKMVFFRNQDLHKKLTFQLIGYPKNKMKAGDQINLFYIKKIEGTYHYKTALSVVNDVTVYEYLTSFNQELEIININKEYNKLKEYKEIQ